MDQIPVCNPTNLLLAVYCFKQECRISTTLFQRLMTAQLARYPKLPGQESVGITRKASAPI